MDILEEKKDTIIDLFCKINYTPEKIVKLLFPNDDVKLEDIYNLFEQYQKDNNVKLKRGKDKSIDVNEYINKLKEEYGLDKKNDIKNEEQINLNQELVESTRYKKEKIRSYNEIVDEILYLRGSLFLSDDKIKEILMNEGIVINNDMIKEICDKALKEDENKVVNRYITIKKEEIINLVKEGKEYHDIVDILDEKYNNRLGVKRKVIMVLKELGVKRIPRKRHIKDVLFRADISNKEIYDLIEAGKSYKEMSEYFKLKGFNILPKDLKLRGEEIYDKLGKNIPIRYKDFKLYAEEVITLRNNGCSYRAISNHLKRKDISLSPEGVRLLIKKYYDCVNRDLEKEKIKNKELMKKEIDKLRATKGATEDQIKMMCEIYDVEYVAENKVVNISSNQLKEKDLEL